MWSGKAAIEASYTCSQISGGDHLHPIENNLRGKLLITTSDGRRAARTTAVSLRLCNTCAQGCLSPEGLAKERKSKSNAPRAWSAGHSASDNSFAPRPSAERTTNISAIQRCQGRQHCLDVSFHLVPCPPAENHGLGMLGTNELRTRQNISSQHLL